MAKSLFAKLHRRFGHPISRATLGDDVRVKVGSIADGLPIGDRSEAAPLSDESPFEHGEFRKGARVAIVGAGFAGLSAGYYLKKAGADVTIFEARKDEEGGPLVGGRVSTLKRFIPNRIVEAGAELIGLNHPLWLTLALRFELSLSTDTQEAEFSGAGLELPLWINMGTSSRPNRVYFDTKTQDDVFNEIEAAYIKLNKEAADVVAHHPWRSPAHLVNLDSDNVETWIKNQGFSAKAEAVIRFDLENDQTVPVAQQSQLGFLSAVKGGATSQDLANLATPSEYWTQTEVFRYAHGNDALAEKLREEIESDRKRIERSAVAEIDLKARPPLVKTEDAFPRPFDWVVLAVPPTVYNRINGLGSFSVDIQCGPATKYLSHVGKRFWMQSPHWAPSGADDRLGAFWEGTDNQIAYGSFEFDLSLFSGGSKACNIIPARRTASGTLDEEIEAVFPDYKNAVKAARPIDWPQTDWIKTGYSCPAPGEVTSKGKVLNQRHGRLVFAGEHTSMAFFGYMEGALQSGLRAASQIVGLTLRA